uniref:Uncharacterized protein n=1 Tax=Cacopsylla melanoneura TaxID=428564 RepID=A0A8D8VQN1_9HEMI
MEERKKDCHTLRLSPLPFPHSHSLFFSPMFFLMLHLFFSSLLFYYFLLVIQLVIPGQAREGRESVNGFYLLFCFLILNLAQAIFIFFPLDFFFCFHPPFFLLHDYSFLS